MAARPRHGGARPTKRDHGNSVFARDRVQRESNSNFVFKTSPETLNCNVYIFVIYQASHNESIQAGYHTFSSIQLQTNETVSK